MSAQAWRGFDDAARAAGTNPNLTPAQAAIIARQYVHVDRGPLIALLGEMLADGYLVGRHTAFDGVKKARRVTRTPGVKPSSVNRAFRQAAASVTTSATSPAAQAAAVATVALGGAARAADAGEIITEIDWSAWEPGWDAAARLVDTDAEGVVGLQRLLEQRGLSIRGATVYDYDRLGMRLYDGLQAGDSIDTIGRAMRDVISDPARARTIANTETNRAMTQASMDAYDEAGITQWEWLAEDTACDDCADMAESNPHDMDEETPPFHPNCRCADAPIVPGFVTDEDMQEATDLGDSEGLSSIHPELTLDDTLSGLIEGDEDGAE